MNDHDLELALQRDADLVGEPAPDLLDQLSRRRSDQRRQRIGGLAAVAAVVVLAAGVPLGLSAAARSGGPAAEPTTTVSPAAPTSPTAPTPVPTPSAAPATPVPTTASAPATPSGTTAAPSTIPAPPPSAPTSTTTKPTTKPTTAPTPAAPATAGTTDCPSFATLQAAMQAGAPAAADTTYAMDARYYGPVCSGDWAGAGYSRAYTDPATGEVFPDGEAGLFHRVGGRWTLLDRTASCDDPAIPRPVWERACNVD
ncbi:hypothetical protein [Goekera deserti]|uniref:Uncharacterized protein n=1 Tax=Goekera deserti TaxID=2497753 RepID=A0A7K3WB10_9ACTN|nr:hypothetical protein [Goekera deserti]NDI49272.1 hypothetical protein [Goekera deserti]NEL53010.1 hypothetical protein [Goekera deserti]